MITIIAVGKKHEPWINIGLNRYETRLKRPFDVKWVLLPHSTRSGQSARVEESERIESQLSSSDYVILLDETGRQFDSPALTSLLEQQFTHARSLKIIIGGAHGVDENLKARANLVWSLSRLVFPHQLVRLMLIEQIYRAQTIMGKTPYHHE